MHIEKYIEALDEEIELLIQKESKGLTTTGERDLHYLFSNRANAKHLIKSKDKEHDNPRPHVDY